MQRRFSSALRSARTVSALRTTAAMVSLRIRALQSMRFAFWRWLWLSAVWATYLAGAKIRFRS